jgi:hypothetical protein
MTLSVRDQVSHPYKTVGRIITSILLCLSCSHLGTSEGEKLRNVGAEIEIFNVTRVGPSVRTSVSVLHYYLGK